MMKDDIMRAIENIEGVTRVYRMAKPVDMVNGETLLQINIYYPTPAPDVNIHVGDNVKMAAEVK